MSFDDLKLYSNNKNNKKDYYDRNDDDHRYEGD